MQLTPRGQFCKDVVEGAVVVALLVAIAVICSLLA